MTRKTLLTIVLLVILAPLAFSLSEDFQAQAPAEVAVFQCAPATSEIRISNTGSVTSVYSVFQDGPAAAYTSLDFPTFQLQPGQTAILTNSWTIPCDLEGSLQLNTLVQSTFGLQKSFSQKLVMYKPDNIDLTIEDKTQTIAVCEQAEYDLTLFNPVNFDEEYHISLSRFQDIGTISANDFTLIPGEAKNVTVRLAPTDCAWFGSFPFQITINTTNAKTFESTDMMLEVKPTFVPQVTIDQTTFTNRYDQQWLTYQVTNIGDVVATYALSFDGPNFIALDQTSVTVGAGQTEQVTLVITPTNESVAGTYPVTLRLTVDQTGNQYMAAPITVVLKPHNAVTRFYADHPVYSWLIVVGAVILGVLILLIAIKLSSEEYQKQRALRREEKRKQRAQKKAEKAKRQAELRKQKAAEKRAARDRKKEAIQELKSDYILVKKKSAFKALPPGVKAALAVILALIIVALVTLAVVYWTFVAAHLVFVFAGLLVVVLVISILLVHKLRDIDYFSRREQKIRDREQRLEKKLAQREKKAQDRLEKEKKEWEQKLTAEKQAAQKRAEPAEAGPLPKWVFLLLLALIIFGVGGLLLSFWQQLGEYWQYILLGCVLLLLLLAILLWSRSRKKVKHYRRAKGYVSTQTKWKSGLGEARMKFSKQFENVTVTLRRGRARDTFVVPKTDVYQYFSVSTSHSQATNRSVSFRVKKSWLDTHEDVMLMQFGQGTWRKVDAKKVSQDKKYVYYKASVGSFGHFAITAKKKKHVERKFWPYFLVLAILVVLLGVTFVALSGAQDPDFNGIPRQIWTQDTLHTLDLTQFFADPDQDALIFSVTPTNHISIFIDRDGTAVFTPDAGFVGEETVIFSARDDRGGVVSSNSVPLIVESSIIPVAWLPTIKWGIVGIILLVLLIVVVQFRKQLARFME